MFASAPTYTFGGPQTVPSYFGAAPGYFGTFSQPPQPVSAPTAVATPRQLAPSVPLYGAPERNPEPFATRLLYDSYTNEPQGYARVGRFGKKQQGPTAPTPGQANVAGTEHDPIVRAVAQQQEVQMQQLIQQQQQLLQQQGQQFLSPNASRYITPGEYTSQYGGSQHIPTVTAPMIGGGRLRG